MPSGQVLLGAPWRLQLFGNMGALIRIGEDSALSLYIKWLAGVSHYRFGENCLAEDTSKLNVVFSLSFSGINSLMCDLHQCVQASSDWFIAALLTRYPFLLSCGPNHTTRNPLNLLNIDLASSSQD